MANTHLVTEVIFVENNFFNVFRFKAHRISDVHSPTATGMRTIFLMTHRFAA